LTIVKYDRELCEYTLDYPNEEVRTSFADSLMEHYLHVGAENKRSFVTSFPRMLITGDIENAMKSLTAFFAAIPYDLAIREEKYYQTILHIIFTMLGMTCGSEVRIAAGRIDALIETNNYIYCFEYKLNGSADEALEQIDSKDYLLPWAGSGKKLIKVGVSFNFEKRNIGEWKAISQ
jgi:ATP-dependent exoDNAse (exonuclease V) beta subunit